MASRANRVIKPQKQLNGPIGYPSFLSEHLGVDGRVMPIFCDSAGNRSNFLLMYDRIRDNLFKLEGQFHSVNVSKIRSFKIEVHAQLIFNMTPEASMSWSLSCIGARSRGNSGRRKGCFPS